MREMLTGEGRGGGEGKIACQQRGKEESEERKCWQLLKGRRKY